MKADPKTSPKASRPAGWIAPVAIVIALGAVGWLTWSQMSTGPAVGEKIELAPMSEVRNNPRGLAENAANALRNLGRNRRAASQPATAPTR